MDEGYMKSLVTPEYLRQHPDEIFVFGDNTIRKGKKGAAICRGCPNAYGFITKKFPSLESDAYYKPAEYKHVFEREMSKLMKRIEDNPDKTFLISKLGAGLANKYHIWERVIEQGLEVLARYNNVRFLYKEE